MKALSALVLCMACLPACSKDATPVDIKGTFIDGFTRRDTIIISDKIFHNDFSYKPYRWQDSSLTATYFFYCRSYVTADTIAVLSLLSSSGYYIKAYFKPQPGNQAFTIDSFYDWRNPLRKEIFVRIK